MIVEVNKKKEGLKCFPDYVQSDIELIDHIGDIVEGVWCGSDEISIHGTTAKEGGVRDLPARRYD